MLESTFEWERLIHPNPTDEMVARRTAIVDGILESIDSEKDVNELVRLVSAALAGLSPTIAADVECGRVLTEATKQHHQAFPSLLSENALDLRLTACLTVGELLVRKFAKGRWLEPRTAVAGLCLSTAGLMSNGNGLHLMMIHEALLAYSRELLARTAKAVRQRPEYDPAELEAWSPSGDTTTHLNQLKSILTDALDSITCASAIDRDELEVLWWLYNNESTTFAKTISDLNAYEVALGASIELVDRALCPAPASLNGIIQGHVVRASKNLSAPAKGLKSVVGSWTIESISTLMPKDQLVRNMVNAWPKALPLTWIACKIVDAGVLKGWEPEFASRTGVNPNLKITPEALANQVFAERTAQRLLSSIQGD